MNINDAELIKPTRRCPVARFENLALAKELNLQIAGFGKPQSEDDAAVLQLLHLRLEEALGGVQRPAQGFLPGSLKPATLRPAGQEGWAEEVRRYRKHEERLGTITDSTKRLDFVEQFGVEHQPILNNRHEKRAWLRIVRDL
jgi:hypothetical protein